MKHYLSRRNFLNRSIKGIASASLLSMTDFGFGRAASVKLPRTLLNCEFGVEGSAPVGDIELLGYLDAIRGLGAGFIVCQFAPEFSNEALRAEIDTWSQTGSVDGFNNFARACKKFNLTFFVNQEVTNYTQEGDLLDVHGKDILAHPDKTHRWDITGRLLESVSKNPGFRGVMYDEAEHGQMRRTANTNGGADDRGTGRVHPYFAATDGMTLTEAYEAVYKSALGVAENYRNKGVIPMTESVFPAMLFTFARAGFDIAIKFMKEGIDPVFAAIAMGAARQYGREFCVTPDLWGLTGFPGHPPEELRASLLYAYWSGSTRIFVENIRGLIEKRSEDGIDRYETSEYGKVYQWFVKEYVPGHPRPYTFKDARPEVAILRFDDSCWGQSDSWLPDALYGAANLKTTPETSAWFQIWNILTHGHTTDKGISFHSKSYNGLPHDFFCPLRDVIVYDHLAGDKELDGLKLVFLTGVLISPKTMTAVRAFVRKGGLCISLGSLAPAEFKGITGEKPDGSGRWLIVNDFRSEEVRNAVAPFLGKPDEISCHFAGQRLMVKKGENGNSIRVYLTKNSEKSQEGDISESDRIW